ncbi:MAG: cell wall-binding repeat-containing protein, partial [Corynebacterium casei]
DQAKIYEDLLTHPNVGLALDPEWKIGPDEVPMTNVGHVEAEEVNEVSDWLAQLVQDNELPQKGVILHQFQLQMLRDRDQIRTDHPELSFILHADGHGDAGQKLDTWNAMREGLSPDFFMAWKNFIDEDTPMFDPTQTYGVNPRPWFVSYQ